MTVGSAKKIPLVEAFGPTVQGEGMLIGTQTYFMRFGLCDYKCGMCDSLHAVTPSEVKKNARWLTQDEIYETFLADTYIPNSTRWIPFSGGNPCIHDLSDLVHDLQDAQFKIAVETQGTFCPDWLQKVDVVTISPKGPGMQEKFELDRFDDFVCRMKEVCSDFSCKVVAFDQRDLEFMRTIYDRYQYAMVDDMFYISLGNTIPPHLDDGNYDLRKIMVDNYKILFDDIKKDPMLSRMSFLPQWHAFVWGNAQGY